MLWVVAGDTAKPTGATSSPADGAHTPDEATISHPAPRRPATSRRRLQPVPAPAPLPPSPAPPTTPTAPTRTADRGAVGSRMTGGRLPRHPFRSSALLIVLAVVIGVLVAIAIGALLAAVAFALRSAVTS